MRWATLLDVNVDEILGEATNGSVDQRVMLHRVSWRQYEAALRRRGEGSVPRIAYLRGELELMTPSYEHEEIKKTIARLVEAYADEQGIDLIGAGSWTLKSRARQVGVEADECYLIGRRKRIPDLAIEVVRTSGGVDKLEIYKRLGVREVWFWRDGAIEIFVLRPTGYRRSTRSRALPGLDVAFLASFVGSSQARAVRAFRAALRGAH